MSSPKEYTMIFNAITDAIVALEAVIKQLKEAQEQAENEYIIKEPAVPLLINAPAEADNKQAP